jgi:hypothetical protein
MLTPELQVVSRWAYVNGTYLVKKPSDKAVTAAVCVLYPCVRTYTASVSNGQLSEKQIGADMMQLDLRNVDDGERERGRAKRKRKEQL